MSASHLNQLKTSFQKGELPKPEYIDKMHQEHQTLFEYADFIKNTDIEKIEICDGQVIMTVREGHVRVICDRNDKRIAPIDILNFGSYEAAETAMMKALIGPNDTVMDIGANIGFYAVALAKAFPNAKIHAFEPIPGTYGYLLKHLELNQVKNVIPHNFGLSDREERVTFYFYPEGSVNASAANLTGGESVREVACDIKRLDDFVKSQGIKVDFIKCDVEGAELFAFRGAMEVIRRHRPAIFTEMLRKWSAKFNYHPNEIIQLLADAGYVCCTVQGDKLKKFTSMDESTIETNFFFLHGERHAAELKARLL